MIPSVFSRGGIWNLVGIFTNRSFSRYNLAIHRLRTNLHSTHIASMRVKSAVEISTFCIMVVPNIFNGIKIWNLGRQFTPTELFLNMFVPESLRTRFLTLQFSFFGTFSFYRLFTTPTKTSNTASFNLYAPNIFCGTKIWNIGGQRLPKYSHLIQEVTKLDCLVFCLWCQTFSIGSKSEDLGGRFAERNN